MNIRTETEIERRRANALMRECEKLKQMNVKLVDALVSILDDMSSNGLQEKHLIKANATLALIKNLEKGNCL